MLYTRIDLESLRNPDHQKLLENFEIYLDGFRAPSTVASRVTYAFRLCRFAEEVGAEREGFNVWDLTYLDLSRWLSRKVGPKPETKHSARCSISQLYGFGQQSGLFETNLALKLPKIRRPRGLPKGCPTEVLEKGISRATRQRDILMLLLGSYGGLRAKEISQAHPADVIDGRRIHIVGKGDVERIVPLHPVIRELLPLFPDRYFFPSDHSPTGHVLPASIGKRIRWLLDTPGWNAHSLRHRFGISYYGDTHDLLGLKELLGHACVSTTQIYAKADVSKLDASVERLERIPSLKKRQDDVWDDLVSIAA